MTINVQSSVVIVPADNGFMVKVDRGQQEAFDGLDGVMDAVMNTLTADPVLSKAVAEAERAAKSFQVGKNQQIFLFPNWTDCSAFLNLLFSETESEKPAN